MLEQIFHCEIQEVIFCRSGNHYWFIKSLFQKHEMIFVCSSTLINAPRNTLSGVVVVWLFYFSSVVCVQHKEGLSGAFFQLL